MRLLSRAISATLLMAMSGASQAQESRELVRLPEPMQEHMLGDRPVKALWRDRRCAGYAQA